MSSPCPPSTIASTSRMLTPSSSARKQRKRALYRLRQQTVEPVFGIIKEVLGFRRFSLRGLAGVELEWTLVCLVYNLRRLHRLQLAAT